MKCSVIIPFKNRLDALNQAIASVAAQSLACNELILVNDGGQPPDLRNLTSLLCGNVKYIENPISRGAAAARNAGARASSSDLLCFLDSDDQWRCDHLELGLELLSTHNEVDLLINSYGKATSSRRCHNGEGFFRVERVPHFQFAGLGDCRTSGFMIKKDSFWSVGGFDEKQHKHQDWDLAMRFWEAGLAVGFNRRSTVIIDAVAAGRMSYTPNPEASLRFYRTHKKHMNSVERWGFKKGILKGMIKRRQLSGWEAVIAMFL